MLTVKKRASLKPGSAAFALFFTAFVVVVELMMPVFGSSMREQRASASWPTVQGSVVAARVIEGRGRRGPTFRPEIEYVYTVGGIAHRGNRYRVVHMSMGWRSWAEDIVAQHPPSAPVTVYYDPSDPARAVLSPGGGWGTKFITVFRVIPWTLAIGGWAAIAVRIAMKHRSRVRARTP